MTFEIDVDILNNTDKCKNNFSCLFNGKECLCNVERCINGNICFVKPLNGNRVCDYKLSWKNTFICNCPTRKEIYNRYKI